MGYSLGECAFLVSPVVKKGIHFLITLTVCRLSVEKVNLVSEISVYILIKSMDKT